MSCSYFFRSLSARRRSVVCRKVCSPFFFCLLLLFLVLAATPFTSSPGRLSSFPLPSSWMTAVSAAPLRPNVFPGPVQLATACDICQDMIMHLVLQIARELDYANRAVATQEDTEVFMEHLCEPDNVGGSWIRRLGLLVVPDVANDRNSPVHFELRVLKDYTKCKRGCVTISELCESLKEAPFFDVLPDDIVALSQKADLVMDGNAVRELGVSVCGHFEVCEERKKYMASLNALLNEPGSSLRSEIERDTIEWISREVFETELKTYESQEKYNRNSFSSKQLEELYAAFARGDRQAASAIDKSVSTLTEEEFDQLHKLALEQEMGMKNEFSNGEEKESEKELEFTHFDKEKEGNVDSVRESEEEKPKMGSSDDL